MVQIFTRIRGSVLQSPQDSCIPWGAEDDVQTGAVHSVALALLDVQMEGSHLVAHGWQGSLGGKNAEFYLWLREGNNDYGEKQQRFIFQHVSLKTSAS